MASHFLSISFRFPVALLLLACRFAVPAYNCYVADETVFVVSSAANGDAVNGDCDDLIPQVV